MQLWPEAAPKRRPRQAECGPRAALRPQRAAASSIGPGSQAAAWAERPWRSGHGGSYTAPQALVLKLHEQLGTPPPPQGVWRHHFDIEEENVSKEEARRKGEKKKT